jgi:serine/threonine protein kinase
MPSWEKNWTVLRRLGEGGQGTVDLVVSAARHDERKIASAQLLGLIKTLTQVAVTKETQEEFLANGITLAGLVDRVNRKDLSTELGALKQLHLPKDEVERTQAMKRFSSEIRALKELQGNPGVLKLLDSSEVDAWLVTEYHPGGTLELHPTTFAGDALRALRAFEHLVAAVASLHEKEIIHRDIKPANVFLNVHSNLVLGDFGIIFWADAKHQRMTETYERVGSRDWMAPWANRGRRLDQVNSTFDIFPLGKLLWSMLSGRSELPFWYWKDPEHNLQTLNPDAPEMDWINSKILAHTIVEREPDCLKSARDLQARVNSVIAVLEHGGRRVTATDRPCRVCGRGHYKDTLGTEKENRVLIAPTATQSAQPNQVASVLFQPEARMTVRVQACDNCGHVELFHFPHNGVPAAWRADSGS